MKRILIHILPAFVLFSISNAQDSRVDSLTAMTTTLSGDELSRTYYELSVELQESETDSALHYANQA